MKPPGGGRNPTWLATPGVMPAVASVGRTGCCPITGLAPANAAAGTVWSAGRTGRDPVSVLAGTDVTAPRLTKLLMVTLRLITVT